MRQVILTTILLSVATGASARNEIAHMFTHDMKEIFSSKVWSPKKNGVNKGIWGHDDPLKRCQNKGYKSFSAWTGKCKN